MDPAPFIQRLLARISAPRDFRLGCEKQWVLSPGEVADSPGAVFAEEELDRVTGVEPHTSRDLETLRIRGGRREHAATVAYRFPRARLIDGSVYLGGAARLDMLPSPGRHFAFGAPERIPDAVLACTPFGSRFFGHWMTDDLTLQLASAGLGQPVSVLRKPYGHQPAYQNLLGPGPREARYASFSGFTILDDFGQNRFKRKRYEEIRSRFRSGVAPSGSAGVFIRRGKSGAGRILVNEDQVESFLVARGLTAVFPETMDASEILRRTLGARLVVGVEGSHLVHGLFAAANEATLVVLQPPYRFNNVHKDYTDCLGMRYAFTVGQESPGGFRIDLERLSRLLDRLDSAQP